ncbi:MAG: DUF1289 domain-containing protein [Xanthomonadaceae bacterium]|nr:DUF1289 domain-containing protein [Xanthomonadaceae bacterium]
MSDAAKALEPVESPCTGVCRLDESGRCVGCFRSAREIGDWLCYDPARRREIMQALPARAGSLFESE